jgi:uncharacterized protein YggU (UPF0235/DUF167 family)
MTAPQPLLPSISASGRDQGLLLPVRLTPKARRNAITGTAEDADGTRRLKVSVTTLPEGGKANAALVDLLAKSWGLPKSCFSIKSGITARAKTLLLAGAPGPLRTRIEREMQKS